MRFGINRQNQVVSTVRPLMLILVSFVFIFLEKNNPIILSGFRHQLVQGSLPVLNFFYQPFAQAAQLPSKVSKHLTLRDKLREYKRKNKRLLRTNARLSTQLTELRVLSKKLKYKPTTLKLRHTSRVVFTTGQPYQHSLVIRGGAKQGIKMNSSIIYRNYLVGRVIHPAQSSSLVLLIQDTTSRVPVVTEKSGIQGVVSGTGDQSLKLLHVINPKKLKKGEKLFTTGRGGAFSPNLLVGRIAKIKENLVYVKTPVRKNNLDFVFVVDPPQIEDVKEEKDG